MEYVRHLSILSRQVGSDGEVRFGWRSTDGKIFALTILVKTPGSPYTLYVKNTRQEYFSAIPALRWRFWISPTKVSSFIIMAVPVDCGNSRMEVISLSIQRLAQRIESLRRLVTSRERLRAHKHSRIHAWTTAMDAEGCKKPAMCDSDKSAWLLKLRLRDIEHEAYLVK